MKLSKRFLRTLIYVSVSFSVLVLIFLIWSGGSDLEAERAKAALSANITTNIDGTSANHWAWNDMIGWIDFYRSNPTIGPVIVESKQIQGYAESSVGDISLNCDSSGNSSGASYCPTDGTAGYKVKNNGSGDLSGWAWNDLIGWISFCGTDNLASSSPSCPYTGVRYGPIIHPLIEDQPPSDFVGGSIGYAWNDVVGWISFNCRDIPICDPYPSVSYDGGYKVRTEWYPTSTYGDVYSSVFDTEVAGGAQFNSVSFQASKPIGTEIWFQLATECFQGMGTPPYCLGDNSDWKFIGPDGATSSYYEAVWDQKGWRAWFATLENKFHRNARYFRYRIRLKSNKIQDMTPVVNDIIVNWSP